MTLTALEVVPGVDNLIFIFISITAERLPLHQRAVARKVGLALALVLRLVMLTMAVWLTGLTTPVVSILGVALSWKDMCLVPRFSGLRYDELQEADLWASTPC